MSKKLLLFGCMAFIIIVIAMLVQISTRTPCYPPLLHGANYIIAYGSLLDEKSRTQTTASANDIFPIEVRGFARSFGVHGNNRTYLTVVPNKTASFNAGYYAIDNSTIEAVDRREKFYCRTLVPADQITQFEKSASGTFWVYATKVTDAPSVAFPLHQYYYDLFVNGCIEMGERYKMANFAKKCVESTSLWPTDHSMVLKNPPRKRDSTAIDELVSSVLGDALTERKKVT